LWVDGTTDVFHRAAIVLHKPLQKVAPSTLQRMNRWKFYFYRGSVNAIAIHENRINALVSFDYSKRVDHPNGIYTFNNYPVYFFLQLNPQTVDILKKEYQAMGSYLSSKSFEHPFINSDYSYYLNNNDTATGVLL